MRDQTYRMKWIALIDRHLEVSLELIKSCYLCGGERRRSNEDIISEIEGQYRMKCLTLKAHINANKRPSVCPEEDRVVTRNDLYLYVK